MSLLWRLSFAWLGIVLLGGNLFAQPAKQAGPDHLIVASFERFFAATPNDAEGGRLLLNELNCLSCHQAEGAKGVVAKKSAPLLDGVGSRIKHAYLKAFLENPQATKPGTAMPDLFVGDPERGQKIEAITHFLASTGTPKHERPDRKLGNTGRDLYAKVGCVACHGTRDAKGNENKLQPYSIPLGDLRAKYTLKSLKAFLENPHLVRTSGRMPSVVPAKEATEIANYLLQGIQIPNATSANNMKYEYYEGEWGDLPDFAKLKPIASGITGDFDLSVAKRITNMAIRFETYLRIDTEGSYRFYTNSDDGSKLWIENKLVVDNDGIHAPTEKAGKLKLTKGFHKLTVGIFNNGAGVELAVEFEGPGISRQPLGPYLILEKDTKVNPTFAVKADPQNDPLTINPELVAKGKILFQSVGCASCHEMKLKEPSTLQAPALAKLRASEGCLSQAPKSGRPAFALSPAQRTALAVGLSDIAKTAASTPTNEIKQTMLTFNCFACHERTKFGGVDPAVNDNFTSAEKEMGDEGRIPPSLNGVGAKLKPGYLKNILDKGSHDRPYMHTRMPGFGDANVGHLVKVLAELDPTQPVAENSIKQPIAQVKADARHMVGALAFGCIRCHTFSGNKAEGVQGIDMTLLHDRLQHDWFVRFVSNPQLYRPGTRMPASWPDPDGTSLLPKILDGKAQTQIEAVWIYLADGKKAKLPIGTKKIFLPLTPKDEVIIYRNFIEGAGNRAIAVGYPEKAHLAFDANNLRLALIWQGAFIDAARHWTDRGTGSEAPLGDHVIQLPPGSAFAFLEKEDEPWPKQSAHDLGFQFKGYKLAKDNRPTFLYEGTDIEISDAPEAVKGQKPTIRRTIEVRASKEKSKLMFRAAVGQKIEPQADGWYLVNDEYRIRIEGLQAQIRRVGDKQELIVPIRFENKQARFVQEFAW